MKSTKNKKNYVWEYFLITYLILLVVPIASNILLHSMLVDILEKNIKKSSIFALENSMDEVDGLIDEIERWVLRLSNDREVNSFIKLSPYENPQKESILLKNIVQKLINVKTYTDGVIEVFVNSSKNNMVLSSTCIYTNPKEMYMNFNFIIKNTDFDSWSDVFLHNKQSKQFIPFDNVQINEKEYSTVFYIKSLPFNFSKNRLGVIFVAIDREIFKKKFNVLDMASSGAACIYDKDGNIIYSNNPKAFKSLKLQNTGLINLPDEILLDGKKMIKVARRSEASGLTYMALIPKKHILDQLASIKKYILLVILSSVLISIIFAFLISYKNSKPIQDIIRLIKPAPSIKEPIIGYNRILYRLRGNIHSILESNIQIKEKILEQKPIIKTAFLRNLLNGDFTDRNNFLSLLSNTDIKIDGVRHVAAILRVQDDNIYSKELSNEINTIKVLIEEGVSILNNDGDFGSIHCYDPGKNLFVMILSFDVKPYGLNESSDKEKKIYRNTEAFKVVIDYFLKRLYFFIHNQIGLKVFIAVGDVYDDIYEISNSYYQAKQVIDNTIYSGNDMIVWHRDMPVSQTSYYYPIDAEVRLMNVVKAGDIKEVEKQLKLLFVQNYIKRQLPMSVMVNFFVALTVTLSRLTDKTDIDLTSTSLLKIIEKEGASERIFNKLVDKFKQAARSHIYRKNSEDEKFKQRLVAYLKANYFNSQISLNAVAKEFGVSEMYLYHYFKEKIGETFAVSLEKLRIKNAKNLLKNSEDTISRITEMTGYTNIRSFRRAFKRVTGNTPNEYRSLKEQL